MLTSPMQQLGLDEVIYKSGRKTDLYTNTGDYIKDRNILLGKLSEQVNTAFDSTMKNIGEAVPMRERKRIAFEVAKQKKSEILKIVDEVFPMADKAYSQASNISKAKNIVEGNLIGLDSEKPKKKRGRPRKTASKKKTTKKSTKKK
jgi:hypothetical protein